MTASVPAEDRYVIERQRPDHFLPASRVLVSSVKEEQGFVRRRRGQPSAVGERDAVPRGHRALGGFQRHATRPVAFRLSARRMRCRRTMIVCTHPAIMTTDVQSSSVSPAKRIRPSPHTSKARVIHAPRCSATMRHGLDITPLNSRCTPTACPNIPTYAVSSAKIADQYPLYGEFNPLCATPTKITTSETLSGRSFRISPRGLAFPEASATIPS